MANIIESRVTLEDEVFEETIDTMEEPIEVVRPSSYNDLEDLPQVNGVTLMGNKTSEELGIVTTTDIENAVSAEATLRENADTALGGRIDGEKTARENADTALGGRIDGEITNRTNADNALGTRIDNEILARQGGDNNLQTQIDAITSKSDVVDVVADYAALQAYDTQHLGDNDVIKVLDDETHNDAQTYYRWNKTAGTWSYIGSEAPYYSKGQIDQQMQAKQDKLTAGTGISLDGATISADTTVLATKEDLEPEIVADLPTVGDTKKLYLTPTNKTTSGNPITIDLKEDVGQITSFQLDGDTYQQSYTGKNLFPSSVTWTINRAFPNSAQGGWANWAGYYGFLDYIEVEPDTTYTFSNAEHLKFIFGLQYYDSDKNWISGTNDAQTFTTPSNCHYIRGAVLSNTAPTQCQLELGSTATAYEPYAGGVPSPNPDYPQPIQTVTGEQTVEIVGKNLFDKDNMDIRNGYLYSTTFSYRTTNADRTFIVPCEPNTTYTISRSVITSSFRAAYIDLEPSEIPADASSETSLTCAGYIANNSGTSITITTSATAKSLLVHYGNTNTDGVTRIGQSVATIMVEKSASATAYTPYSKQTLPIDLGSIELCKLGTYQDYIYKDDNGWKVHKATGKYVYNDDLAQNGISETMVSMVTPTLPVIRNLAHDSGICRSNMYIPIDQNGTGLSGTTGTNKIRIYTAVSIADSYDKVRQLASANNLTICYPLDAATDTAITDQTLIAQLEAIRTAALGNGANTITNVATGANLAGSMSIGYYGYNPSEYSEWLYVDGAWEQVSGRPIPTKTSDLDNDSEFVTREEIAPKLQTEVVSELPTVGDEGKLYLTPKNYTRGTGTGNPIEATITDGAGKMESFKLDGDTFQQTYTGKNLIGSKLASIKSLNTGGVWSGNSYTKSGITWTVYENDDGTIDRIEANGTSTVSGNTFLIMDMTASEFEGKFDLSQTYTLSGCPSEGSNSTYYARIVSSPWKALFTDTGSGKVGTFELPTGYTRVYVVLCVDPNAGQVNNLVFRPQLELGSTATSYEPYVGGVPSPNPDYPQQIQTVTGEQTVEIQGKNLFDKDSAERDKILLPDGTVGGYDILYATSDFIPVSPGQTYYKTQSLSVRFKYYNANKEPLDTTTYQDIPNANNAQSFVVPSNAHYIRLTVGISYLESLQIELGSAATTYAPYYKQTLPISLGSIELCKLGAYQDYIYKSGSDWKVHKEIGEVTLDGSESWTKVVANSGYRFWTSKATDIEVAVDAVLKANRLGVAQGDTWDNYGISGSYTPTRIFIRDTLFSDMTVEQLQSWLSTHNIIVYYTLATPADTTITDTTLIAQLEAIRTASLENGTNTITNTATGTNLAGDMEIGYYGYNPRNRYDKWLWLDLNNNYEKLGS